MMIETVMDWDKLQYNFQHEARHLDLNISVDCVLFTIRNNGINVLLINSFHYKEYALPGGFVRKDEETDSAASRILYQRTGVERIFLKQFKVFSEPGRFSFKSFGKNMGLKEGMESKGVDFPERVISIGYFALVNFESIHPDGGEYSEDTTWADIHKLPALLFDHALIVKEGADALRRELFFKPVLHNLLPEQFTMPELQHLYEIILERRMDRGSFQRKMKEWDIFDRLEEKRSGVAHKRPFLYKINQEKFDKALEQGRLFGI